MQEERGLLQPLMISVINECGEKKRDPNGYKDNTNNSHHSCGPVRVAFTADGVVPPQKDPTKTQITTIEHPQNIR